MSTENYDACYPDQPVVDQYLPIWANQPAFGPKPAFIWAEDGADGGMSYTTLTYSQLNSAAQCMAAGLLKTLRRGDTVLVLASPGLQLVKLLFACQRAGLNTVPIIPPDPSKFGPSTQVQAHHHLFRAVSQTRPRAAVADARYIDMVMKSLAVTKSSDRLAAMLGSLQWLPVDELEHEAVTGPASGLALTCYKGCGPDDIYLIQYTSGATRVPKPVLVTAGSAAHNVRAARKAYDLQPSSVIVSWLPQYHDCGLMFLLLTIVAGATCVLASPTAFVRRPRLWLELVAEFKATCTPVPSFALPLVLKRGRAEHGIRPLLLGSLRNLILINEPIYKSLVDAFVKEFGRAGLDASCISPSYGLAENCTFVSTAWRCAEQKFWSRRPNLPSYKKLLPSARLSPASVDEAQEIEIVIVDEETGEPVEDGVEGEIWVSSPSNASGYLGHPSASREVFCARLLGRAGPCFVRTGDRGLVYGVERYLYVIGRSADVITLDDDQRRVHAHYIETAAFDSAPDCLRGGCIAAFAMSPLSPSPVVIVAELQKGRDGAHMSICEGIREALWKEEGVRTGWVVLVEGGVVPKTTSGKLQRAVAREKLLAGKLRKVFEALYDNMEGSPWVRGEEKKVEERCATSWTVGEGGEHGTVLAFGSASRRLRLQSFL